MATRKLSLLAVLVLALAACKPTVKPRDDNYRFSSPQGHEIPVRLTQATREAQLQWPATGDWDTALVRIAVTAERGTALVRMSAGGRSIVQYLDPQGRGLRWLNVSALHDVLHPGAVLALSTEDASIDSSQALVRTFDNRLDLGGTILVVAPHPDDAEIAAFGLYSGKHAYVLTVTSGNGGEPIYGEQVKDQARQFRMKGYLRAVDSVTVPWQGGIPPSQAYNMGYFDGRLKEMHDSPARSVPEQYAPNTDISVYRRANLSDLLPRDSRDNNWNNLVEDVAAVLVKVRPSILVMPLPPMDWHPDHQYTTVAVLQALERTGLSPRMLLYTNHPPGTGDRFPYGPAGSTNALPPRDTLTLLPSVYAHPVDADTQVRKLFALESMHDLRLSPSEQSDVAAGIRNPARRPGYPRLPDTDFLRRAPRPHEIFYVFDTAEAQGMIAEFLRSSSKQ